VPNSSASVNFPLGDSSGRRRSRARHCSPSSCRRSDVSRTRSSRFAPMATRWAAHVRVVGGEQTTGPPSSIYVRTTTGHEAAVQELLARTANPEAPNEVNVSQPSDVLTARAAATGAFDSLVLGLGVVALIVGASASPTS
jgi:hypothetical protein